MKSYVLILLFFAFTFTQNYYFGAELETHGNLVSNGSRSYDARPSIEYSVFMMADLTYDIKWRLRLSVGEKVAREPISNGHEDWRFYYYSITPEIKYSLNKNYYLIAGYSFSFLDEGTVTYTSKSENVSVPVVIKPSNFGEGFEQSVNNSVNRILVGIGTNYYLKGLIIMPKLIYYHGFDNALKNNDTYDFTFSSFSFNVGISF